MTDREIAGQNVISSRRSKFLGSYNQGTPNRRPRLLFLAWSFPPMNASACVRTWNIAKYLSRLDWDVTTVTPHPSVWRHVEDPEKTDISLNREGIRRILTGHQWRCLNPSSLKTRNQGLGWFAGGVCRKIARYYGIDLGIGWMKAAEQACSTLTKNDVDMILATGSPFTAFRLAKRLSERLGRPYILDYRDPWTRNPHHAPSPARQATIREEKKLLAGCAAVTVVSSSWGLDLDQRFHLGPKLQIITNGYDPEELAEVQPQDFGHFAIVYTGIFYVPKRVIAPVLAALKSLKETMSGKGGEWYFHYYGSHENYVREEATRFGLMDRVVLHGRVSRAEALSALRGAGVAVVITSVVEEKSIEDKGIVTAKIFDAVGFGIPVLLIAPSGSDAEVVAENSGRARCFTGSDVDGMASFLADVMCGLAPGPRSPETYSWVNIAKRLNAVLHGAAVRTAFAKSEILSC